MSQPSYPPQSSPPNRPKTVPSAKSPPRRLSIRRFFWLLPLFFLASFLLAEVPFEPARWKLAQALEARSHGEKERADALLEEAFQTFPRDPVLLMQRAEWRLEDKQIEKAIEDADLALEVAGENRDWLAIHASFMQTAGRPAAAVEDWKKIDAISVRTGRPSREEALNGLAYFQALANMNLDQALANVEQALELSPGEIGMLDTRGYILYLQKQYEPALADLMKAISLIERDVAQGQRFLAANPPNPRLVQSAPKSIRDNSKNVGNAERISNLIRNAAVIYYHRALVLQALDRDDEAEADLARVRELIGREPDETLF